LLWPALLAEPLSQIATEMAALPASRCETTSPPPAVASAPFARKADRIETHLGALVGRLMSPGGWIAGQRRAGAEPLWTGCARPYDESTLHKHMRQLAQQGGTAIVARAVDAQVHLAVAASGAKAIGYTDMFDQVYWTSPFKVSLCP